MSNKQTAVEWLEQKLKENIKEIVLNLDADLMESLFEQALQLEREQMIDFAKYCFQHTDYVTSYEDCYNKTYGKCTQQS